MIVFFSGKNGICRYTLWMTAECLFYIFCLNCNCYKLFLCWFIFYLWFFKTCPFIPISIEFMLFYLKPMRWKVSFWYICCHVFYNSSSHSYLVEYFNDILRIFHSQTYILACWVSDEDIPPEKDTRMKYEKPIMVFDGKTICWELTLWEHSSGFCGFIEIYFWIFKLFL